MRDFELKGLGVARLASPCKASWDQMQGDSRSRLCGQCSKQVYNFEALTTDEARQLIIEKEGKFCGRIFTRKDGTVLTRDCWVAVRSVHRKLGLAVAFCMVLALSGLASVLQKLGAIDAAVRLGSRAAQLIEERVNPRRGYAGGMMIKVRE